MRFVQNRSIRFSRLKWRYCYNNCNTRNFCVLIIMRKLKTDANSNWEAHFSNSLDFKSCCEKLLIILLIKKVCYNNIYENDDADIFNTQKTFADHSEKRILIILEKEFKALSRNVIVEACYNNKSILKIFSTSLRRT